MATMPSGSSSHANPYDDNYDDDSILEIEPDDGNELLSIYPD